MRARKGHGSVLCCTIFLITLLTLLAGCGDSDFKFSTKYQSVFLDNGQVFFGRLEASDSSYLTLRDVFYVQRVVESEKKEARNLLVKRGSEGHGPDFMQINVRHVVLIEPVALDSRLAQLIREAKAPATAAPPATVLLPPVWFKVPVDKSPMYSLS